MTHKQFFAALEKLYNAKEYPVKYWLQCSTFSFSIYHIDDAFHGKSVFDSEVYYSWDGTEIGGKATMQKIIEDINTKREKIIDMSPFVELKRNIEL